MQLTDRDSKLIRLLSDFNILSTSQVKTFLFPEIRKTTMLRRLRALEENRFLKRSERACRGGYGWSLGPKGRSLVDFRAVRHGGKRPTTEHDVLLSEIRLALIRAGLGENWTSESDMKREAFKYWRQLEAPEPLVPDGLFTAQRKGEFRSIAIELELTPKTKARYRKLFQHYRQKRGVWLLWYLVRTEEFGKRLLEIWRKMAPTDFDPHFGWSTTRDLVKCPASTKIHFLHTTKTLEELFEIRSPAHSPAHGVSTPEPKRDTTTPS